MSATCPYNLNYSYHRHNLRFCKTILQIIFAEKRFEKPFYFKYCFLCNTEILDIFLTSKFPLQRREKLVEDRHEQAEKIYRTPGDAF